MDSQGGSSRNAVIQVMEEAAEAMAREQHAGKGGSLIKGLMFAATIAVGLGALWLGTGPGKPRTAERLIRRRGMMR